MNNTCCQILCIIAVVSSATVTSICIDKYIVRTISQDGKYVRTLNTKINDTFDYIFGNKIARINVSFMVDQEDRCRKRMYDFLPDRPCEELFINDSVSCKNYSIILSTKASAEDGTFMPGVINSHETDDNCFIEDGNDIIVCEKLFQFEGSGNEMMHLQTKYISRSYAEKDSLQLDEIGSRLHVVKGKSTAAHLSSREKKLINNTDISKAISSVISSFQELLINAELQPDTSHVAKLKNCVGWPRRECKVTFYTPFSNDRPDSNDKDLQKMMILLSKVLEPLVQARTTPGYEIRGRKLAMKKYTGSLLYWESLKELLLSGTGISEISEDYFNGVPGIENLDLSGNKFTLMPSGIGNLKNLKKLSLSNNPIRDLEELTSALGNLNNLKYLDLSGLPIGDILTLDPVLKANQLEALRLSGCNIMSLSGDNVKSMLQGQERLRHIDLSQNPITQIDPDIFQKLHSLRFLNLSSSGIDFNMNLRIGKLNELNLSHNRLRDITRILSEGTTFKLDLHGNRIEDWQEEKLFTKPHPFVRSLEPAVRIIELDLSFNRLTTVNNKMLTSLGNLYQVDLGGNPFNCYSCHLKDFRAWILSDQRNAIIRNYHSSRPLTCYNADFGQHFIIKDLTYTAPKCVNSVTVSYYLYLFIPSGVLIIFFTILLIFIKRNKHELAYIQHLEKTRQENRKKAVELLGKSFENDIYMIFSHEDKQWVKNRLQPVLERNPYRYRLVVPDFNDKNIMDADSSIENSRHVVVVVSDSLQESDFSMRCLERANYKLLSGEHHNMIFLMRHGVKEANLPINISLLSSTHDKICWPKNGASEDAAWKKLFHYLGDSNNRMWENSSKRVYV